MPTFTITYYGSFTEQVEAKDREDARRKSAETPFDWNTWYLHDTEIIEEREEE